MRVMKPYPLALLNHFTVPCSFTDYLVKKENAPDRGPHSQRSNSGRRISRINPSVTLIWSRQGGVGLFTTPKAHLRCDRVARAPRPPDDPHCCSAAKMQAFRRGGSPHSH